MTNVQDIHLLTCSTPCLACIRVSSSLHHKYYLPHQLLYHPIISFLEDNAE
jgi:hypothetical protein